MPGSMFGKSFITREFSIRRKSRSAWRRRSIAGARVGGFGASREAAIRAECGALYDKLSQLAPASGATSTYVDLTLICRQLQRI
jgi:hypothetical protein